MKLTEHFTLAELTRTSVRNVDNTPPKLVVARLQVVARRILEALRTHFGEPVFVLSGYRSQGVNAAVGGSPSSQHMRGEAVDFEVRNVAHHETAKYIAQTLEFDQLILEFCSCRKNGPEGCGGWIHCSYTDTSPNRRQILIARKLAGGTSYRLINAHHIGDA